MEITGLISGDLTRAIDKVLYHFKNREEITDEEFNTLMDQAGQRVFEILEGKWASYVVEKYTVDQFREVNEIAGRNSEKIVKLHEDFFHYFFAYIHTTHIVYANFLKGLKQANTKVEELEPKDLTNLMIYGNLCRMSDQIGVQLMHGYPDAALRLWRTFYEHGVVAVFMIKNDSNDLAIRFREAFWKEKKRTLDSYSKRHSDLNMPPLKKDLIERVTKAFESVKSKYEKNFFENDYTWVGKCINGKANLPAIEEAAGMSRYRPFYLWASRVVHPTYEGISDYRDSSGEKVLSYITQQAIDRRSMVDPAQLTLAIFHEVNDHFLRHYSGHEYTANQLLFRKLFERFGEAISQEKVNRK
jgi:uncharacterized protein DUF5677